MRCSVLVFVAVQQVEEVGDDGVLRVGGILQATERVDRLDAHEGELVLKAHEHALRHRVPQLVTMAALSQMPRTHRVEGGVLKLSVLGEGGDDGCNELRGAEADCAVLRVSVLEQVAHQCDGEAQMVLSTGVTLCGNLV